MVVAFLAVRLMEWVGFVAVSGGMSGAGAVRVAMLHFSVTRGVEGRPRVVWWLRISRVSGWVGGIFQCRVSGVGGRC